MAIGYIIWIQISQLDVESHLDGGSCLNGQSRFDGGSHLDETPNLGEIPHLLGFNPIRLMKSKQNNL
jgi:hypothetical protein